MPVLTIGKRPVEAVFDPLGTNETDITFAFG